MHYSIKYCFYETLKAALPCVTMTFFLHACNDYGLHKLANQLPVAMYSGPPMDSST